MGEFLEKTGQSSDYGNIGSDYPLYDGPDCSECNRFFTRSSPIAEGGEGACNIGPEVCNYKGYPAHWTGSRETGNGMCNCVNYQDASMRREGGTLSPRLSYGVGGDYKGGPEGSGHAVSDLDTCSSVCALYQDKPGGWDTYTDGNCSNNSSEGGTLWESESGPEPETTCNAHDTPDFKCGWITEDDLVLPTVYEWFPWL
tara:strand:- start:36 stop:632 length:597 start_codon:yes stop_codon:yes gene_type:complete